MWEKILEFFRWLFEIKSEIHSEIKNTFVPRDNHSDSERPQKPAALAITDKYRTIDWEINPPRYRKRKGVLSFREREFYRLLQGLMGKQYHILSMVRMADVLWLSNETENRKFHNNNILCKHFDYVICDKLKFEPVLVIELDDGIHQWEHRWQVDNFKDKACRMAGLPLLRIKVQKEYDKAEMGKQIREILDNSSRERE